jgi:hypothetical protein
MKLDQDGPGAGGGEVERLAARCDAGERGSMVADRHDASLTAIVTPSRMGTSVVAKSGAA